MKRKLKGFTLVELVITIAIVIILSVISVPIYRGYVDKAKFSEAYALVGTLLSAEKAYYSEYGNFYNNLATRRANFTSYDEVLGVDARGNKIFTNFSLDWTHDNKISGAILVTLPEDFRENGKNRLHLGYNITTGPGNFYKGYWAD